MPSDPAVAELKAARATLRALDGSEPEGRLVRAALRLHDLLKGGGHAAW